MTKHAHLKEPASSAVQVDTRETDENAEQYARRLMTEDDAVKSAEDGALLVIVDEQGDTVWVFKLQRGGLSLLDEYGH